MSSTRHVRRTLSVALFCSLAAHASGFYFGDNGASAMVQGGAFTAQADDALGMQYNPAGLTQISGFHALADVNLLRHDVTFLRQDSGFDPANPSALISTVSSQKTPFLLPYFGAAYGFQLLGRRATVGLGLFAPPSQGRYEYPAPDYSLDAMGNYAQSPKKYAPQRYALLMTDILIAYPTLTLAYELHPRVQLGVSAQLTVSHFKQTQVMYGGDVFCPPTGTCAGDYNPQRQLQENPDYDAIVNIDLPGQVGATVIGGVMARPTDWLAVGASIRPPIPFKAYGPFSVTLPKTFADAGATVSGDRATLEMTMPLEIRVGARVTPFTTGALKDRLGVNFDFVYQGWDSVKQLLLTPDNVTLSSGTGATPMPIAPFAVKKNWQPTWSVRLGASFRAHQFVSVHLGALYETGAAPEATYSVDWTHPTRFIFTGGVTGHLGPVSVIVGALFTPTNTTVVQNSEVLRGQTNPDITAGAVGNGIYTSGGWGLITGLRLNLGGAAPAATPIEAAPALAPADEQPAKTEPAPAAPADAQPAPVGTPG